MVRPIFPEDRTPEMIRRRLEDLVFGNNAAWDYMPVYVQEGLVTRQEALDRLARCLERVIPHYEEAVKSDPTIYRLLLEHAKEALSQIREGRTVVYRGVRL